MTDAAFDRELVAALPKLRRFAFGLAGSLDEGDDRDRRCREFVALGIVHRPGQDAARGGRRGHRCRGRSRAGGRRRRG